MLSVFLWLFAPVSKRCWSGAVARRLLRLGIVCIGFLTGFTYAQSFLPANKAFPMQLRQLGDGRLQVDIDTVQGYYLYRDIFKWTLAPASGLTLVKAELPKAERKDDPTFGVTEVYHGPIAIPLVVKGHAAVGSLVELTVVSQGCAEAGICYPPEKTVLTTALTTAIEQKTAVTAVATPSSTGAVATTPVAVPTASTSTAASAAAPTSVAKVASKGESNDESARLLSRLNQKGGAWSALLLFFVLGLGLALTPCVYPLTPIVLSLIVGQSERPSPRRSFWLSLAYVEGMALTFTVAGVIAALIGALLATFLQNPWVLGATSLLMVVFALSMFGLFDIALPSRWQQALSKQPKGSGALLTAFMLGALSALVVGPCVAPPLFAALLYISQSGDLVFGGLALFALAQGMGVPLIALAVSAGAWLPKSGAWMVAVKQVFGVLLLLLAWWVISPFLPAGWFHFGVAVLALMTSVYLLGATGEAANAIYRLGRGVAVLLGAYALALLVSVWSGQPSFTTPLAGVAKTASVGNKTTPLTFEPIDSVAALQAAIAQAQNDRRPVLIDYYADWCVSCKEMEQWTFTDAEVSKRMVPFRRLRVDVTQNRDEDRALLQVYGLFGPPAILFYDSSGRLSQERVVGFMAAEPFAALLDRVVATH